MDVIDVSFMVVTSLVSYLIQSPRSPGSGEVDVKKKKTQVPSIPSASSCLMVPLLMEVWRNSRMENTRCFCLSSAMMSIGESVGELIKKKKNEI